ncbi:MAG: T9SS type A sorting domain-containing protein [Bacteroidetes bacterium]|nr:T9SS type A sorting domain-containing protein [Bacteroidota bacterium]
MKYNKARILILSLSLLLFNKIEAQVVTTEPAFPTVNNTITIIFDATKGDEGLKDFTGDIYAHTGVITEKSSSESDWKYVIAEWTENISKAKLTQISTNIYQLKITPNILEYYDIPEIDEVLKMTFVFRNEDGSKTGRDIGGKDIFIDIYQSGINVNILLPQHDLIIPDGQNIKVQAVSNEADSILLFIDNTRILSTDNDTLNYEFSDIIAGKHWIKVFAKNNTDTVADSVYYYIRGEIIVQDLPDGFADGINYIDENTVTLVLFAPNKQFVYAIGDFNNWELSEQYLMKKTTDDNRYWITIDNLISNKEYIFQYFIDGEVKIADPYTDKTSNPWNDKYISDDIYPDLIQYPTDKTTEVASVFQTAQTPFNWQTKDFTPPNKEDLVIYELLVRDYTSNRDFKTIRDTLNYLKTLGVNAIEFMPVNEFEGNDSWGYNPAFYFAVDKAYGSKEDFKRLIDECHKNGMAVIIDLVLNHTYGQSPMVRMYWDDTNNRPATDNPWYNQQSNFTNADAQWGYDLNHESVETQKFVDSVNSYWLTQYHVDGFRFDFTKGFSNTIHGSEDPWGGNYDVNRIAILKRMSDKIWQIKNNAYVIFEHLSENSEETELANYGIMLWGNLNYNYNEATMGWTGSSDFLWISYKERGWSTPNVIGYMESHDEERLMYRNLQYGNFTGDYNTKEINTALRRMELAATFFLTIPGPKMIWQFGELGYDYSIDYNGRVGKKPINWDYFDNQNRLRLYQVYSALIKIKKEQSVFRSTDYSLSLVGAKKIININSSSMDVTIIGNFGVEENSIDPSFQKPGKWYDYFAGDSIGVNDPHGLIKLEAGEYKIYTTKKLTAPNVVTRINSISNGSKLFQIYPNPTTNSLHLNNDKEINRIVIHNIIGSQVKEVNDINSQLIDINVSDFQSGLYFVSVYDKSGKVKTRKFTKK